LPLTDLETRDLPVAVVDRSAFACVGLAADSRARQAPIARRIIREQPSALSAELDGIAFDIATFPATSEALPRVLCLVGDLRSAVIWVNGQHYPPGQHTRLYQWLVCFQRMQKMRLPIGACDYNIGGYRLPCSLLGAFCAFQMPAHADPAQYLELAAAREGFDRCPRYVAERLSGPR
jgi:hypothetical protein